MASQRETILDEFETRMSAIDGTSGYINNLSGVSRIAEVPDAGLRDFTSYPIMFYQLGDIDVEYEIGSRVLETMTINAFTIFNAELNPSQIYDLVSDIENALVTSSNDVTMNGNADFFLVESVPGGNWLEEENLTVVHVIFTCQYRRSALVR